MRRRGHIILYVGSRNGFEAKLVPEKGFPFYTVKTGSVKNQGVFKIMKTLFQLFFAISWAMRFLYKEKPVGVIGVGGYVSVPICVGAFLLRVPVFLQEQNVSVGIANRFLGRLSRKIFLGFEQAKICFNPEKCEVTGNPIRKEFSATDFPKYDPGANCLLILGGSQGARSINEAITGLLETLQSRFPGISVIHQTGQKDYDRVKDAYAKAFKGKYQVSPFISDMASAYGQASLVISRSGALTVSELIQVGRPAILVPYPRKGQNDQTANAYMLESRHAAKTVEQGPDFHERFGKALFETFQKEVLKQMGEGYIRLRSGGALTRIGDAIEGELGAVSRVVNVQEN